MHDYFEILGVSPRACSREIQRARQRRVWAGHPDVRQGDAPPASGPAALRALDADAAIDFVDMAAVVGRMRAAFFTVL